MSIIVVCPGCRKSFKVSDKFAGRTGPCPNCKHLIRVPTKDEEVKIHVPTQFAHGGRSREGKLLLKPIARQYPKFQPVVMALVGSATLATMMVTWLGGRMGLFLHPLATAIGLLLISPPLTLAAYEILRDDELEPYRGLALYIRAGLCGLGYAILWGVFALFIAPALTGELWNWVFILPPFVAIGGLMALAAFDLEYGAAVLHCSFYLIVTLLLRWLAAIPWSWYVEG